MEHNHDHQLFPCLIGHKVGDHKLEIYHEGKFKDIKLSDYQSKWLVLFFYPADFTFVCPTELKEMAALYPEFEKADAEVLSVSTDTVFSHKAWHDSSDTVSKINFPMAADPTGKLCQELGIYIQEEGLSLRGSFVINPQGEIKALEIHDNGIGRSATELLRKLQAAQFVDKHGDQVCPANWKPGGDTLKPGEDLVGKI